ncbi:phage holin family protein [Phytomonospora endophytica]|uniref:Putative membrane protein n=1 Tax=Phytomonospora endophytica TaxID=714109 RepID=A0A841FQM8_9ACTN|nr:phage holin family protein [Phytomonospora endophytica]MBB6037133.1 putative membrane protein [Phytomonospora endophytica]
MLKKLLILLLKIAASALSIWVATLLIDDITIGDGKVIEKIGVLVAVAVIFGLVNAVIKPIVKTIGCAFYVLTLGLLALVVNALLFLLTSAIAGAIDLSFHVEGFWAALWGALIVGLVNWGLNLVIPDKKGKKKR